MKQDIWRMFAISGAELYCLVSKINRAFKALDATASEDNTAVYRVNVRHSIIVSGGFFTITNDNGDVLDRISVKDFARSPRAGFVRIKRSVE